MQTVIIAGGKGSRIRSVAEDIPKPMINICGKPALEHEIDCLRDQGFTDIILTVGYLGKIIMDYFGDGSNISPVTGKAFGVHIEYYYEKEPLGNAGALFDLREKLDNQFLLLNGDIIFNVDLQRFIEYHKTKGALATIFTHPNSHPYDSSLVIANKDGAVTEWLGKEEKRPLYYKNRVNAGLHIMSLELLNQFRISEKKRIDLDQDILKPLAGTGKLYCYDSPEYVHDMGTPDRYEKVCHDYISRKIEIKNLKKDQTAIFLDRDGTINKYIGFLRKVDDFELLPGVAEAIKIINDLGYLAIVVTNQPVIARGEVTVEELQEIHNKMETLLGEQGAYLDAIYYCPHHPHKGYAGEVKELKVQCSCRKPRPGLLRQAAEDFHIKLAKSWMIGDEETDVQAGIAAGCHTAWIHKEKREGQDSTIMVSSLLDFVKNILVKQQCSEEGDKITDGTFK